MTYPEVQFVAAPEDGAEVLFDFNDGAAPYAETRVVADGFTLGTPSILGNPDGLGVEYGPRVMSFTLEISGNRSDALRAQATLARAFMLRRRGWLRVQLDEFTMPVWLRTYTPTPGELDFDLVFIDGTTDRWAIGVQVAAEPFIRGERITLGSWTINNDPAAASNPMSVMLPGIVGDAPSPLRITATFSAVGGMAHHDIAWSCAAVPDDFAPVVWQVGSNDGWTLAGNMSEPVIDSSASAGTCRTVASFGAIPTMETRLAGQPLVTPKPGRHRVFLRAGRSDSTSVFAVRLGYRTGNGDLYGGSARVVLDRNAWSWMDLGSFEFPLPYADVDVPAASAAPVIALAAERVSGSGDLLLDAFFVVPESLIEVNSLEPWEKSDLLVSEFATIGPPPGQTQMWDGDSEVTARAVGDGVDAQIGAANRGRFPTVRPGLPNLLTLIQQARSSESADYPSPDSITYSAAVAISYQPRWLWLGDS